MKITWGTVAGHDAARGPVRRQLVYMDWLPGWRGALVNRWRSVATGVVMVLASAGHGMAASQADWNACRSSDQAVNVPACNRIMEDVATSTAERNQARLGRALAYIAQNSYVAAARDLFIVLDAEPGNARALAARAMVEFRRGNTDQAMLDYGLARRLDAQAVDSMLNAYGVLKDVAQAYEQKPPPQARLDELHRPLIRCRTGTRLENVTCVPITCPAGERLDGNSCVQVVCGTGYRLQGSTCMPITCPAGQRLDGNSCVQVVCGTGYRLQGSTCTQITCPTGERLSGNDCIRIVCGSDETLVGSNCVQNKKYGALVLSRTRRLAYGVAWDRPTASRAQADAMDQCRINPAGTNCKLVMTSDDCIALFWTKTGNGWGAASRSTKEEAESEAASQCRSVNRNCVKAVSFCSGD